MEQKAYVGLVDAGDDFIWNVYCFEDSEYVTKFFFYNAQDAEKMRQRWISGEPCVQPRHSNKPVQQFPLVL